MFLFILKQKKQSDLAGTSVLFGFMLTYVYKHTDQVEKQIKFRLDCAPFPVTLWTDTNHWIVRISRTSLAR